MTFIGPGNPPCAGFSFVAEPSPDRAAEYARLMGVFVLCGVANPRGKHAVPALAADGGFCRENVAGPLARDARSLRQGRGKCSAA